ncbi:MAG: hypothetical protein U1F43_36330 [Myxococcota bacterium]
MTTDSTSTAFLSPSERELVLAVADAATPPGARIHAADDARIARAEALLDAISPSAKAGWKVLVHAFDLGARATTGPACARWRPTRAASGSRRPTPRAPCAGRCSR